jgi:hypothetical protein
MDALMCADWHITAPRWRMSPSMLAVSPAVARLLNAPEEDLLSNSGGSGSGAADTGAAAW